MERFLAVALSILLSVSPAFASYETLSNAIDLRQLVPTAKCDGTTDDSAALAKADAMVKIGAIGIYATCRLSSNVTLAHALFVGPQGALSVDVSKTLTIVGLQSDTATPFPGAGTVAYGTTNTQLANIKIGGPAVAPPAGQSMVSQPGVVFPASTGLNFAVASPTANDTANFQFIRKATFTGGTPGNTNNALAANCSVVAGATDNEWCFLAFMDNYGTLADASQNVAGYFQAKKRSTGATWATTFEVRDYNTTGCGAGSLHPCVSAAPVGTEIDVSANDVDPSGNRTILNLVGMPLNLFDGTVTNTTAPTIDYALRIGCYNGDSTKCNFGTGIQMGPAAFNVGLDMSQITSFTSAGIWMAASHSNPHTILWGTSAPQSAFEYYDPSLDAVTNGGIAFDFGTFGTRRFSFYNTGQARISDGTVDMRIQPLAGSSAGILATASNHDLVLQAFATEQIRVLAAGGVKMAALPGSAGAGGLSVCIDNAGVLYKKATCP